jgi:hypothetical protein
MIDGLNRGTTRLCPLQDAQVRMVEDASGRRCPHRRSAKPSRPPGRGLSAIEALRRTILRTGVGWTSRARVRTSTTAQVVGVTSERKGLSPFSTDQTPLPRARYHRHAWLEFQRALDPLGTPKPRPPSALSVLRLRGVRRAMSQSEQVESLPQTRPRAERRPPENPHRPYGLRPLRRSSRPGSSSRRSRSVEHRGRSAPTKPNCAPASGRRRGYGPPMYSRSIESARSRVHLP